MPKANIPAATPAAQIPSTPTNAALIEASQQAAKLTYHHTGLLGKRLEEATEKIQALEKDVKEHQVKAIAHNAQHMATLKENEKLKHELCEAKDGLVKQAKVVEMAKMVKSATHKGGLKGILQAVNNLEQAITDSESASSSKQNMDL